MRTLGIAVFIVVVAAALPAVAQDKNTNEHNATSQDESPLLSSLPTGSMPVTPEMWFYEQQLREYLSPKMAVRRNAEFRAKQRRNRLAGCVLEHNDRSLRVDVAAEIGSQQHAILLAHEESCAVGSTTFTVVSDTFFVSLSPPCRRRLKQIRQSSDVIPKSGQERLADRQQLRRRHLLGVRTVGVYGVAGEGDTAVIVRRE